jgi:hypothetical protein
MAERERTGEPYKLAGDRIVFTNWHYVRPARFGWYDSQGKSVYVVGDQGPFDAHVRWINRPVGVRLTVRPALRSGPILTPEKPWEADGVSFFTVLKKEGGYHAWGSTGWGDLTSRGSRYICYFESSDGRNWKRPPLGILEYQGNRDNNLLHGDYPNLWGSVFFDPSAPDSERYKFIVSDFFSREACAEYRRRRPEAVDPKCERTDINETIGVRGGVSPDGLRWTMLEQPLVLMHDDGPEVAYYDTHLKKYVGYFRDWMVGPQAQNAHDEKGMRWKKMARRAVGRSETEDFRNFPLSDVVLEPHPEMSPSEVLYTNCYTTIPGAPDQHLMFPAVWDTVTDTTYLTLAASYDGRMWHYRTPNRILDTAEFGEWDGGCVFAVPNLIELPDGDFALPYTGFNVPHKYPRVKATRATGYALWPKGRIAALEASEKGEFTTVAVIPPGRHLLVNAVTQRTGSILVEALNLDQEPIPGREFANSIPIVGDQHRCPVVWKGHDDLGIGAGEAVILRFRMEQASLFALDFS